MPRKKKKNPNNTNGIDSNSPSYSSINNRVSTTTITTKNILSSDHVAGSTTNNITTTITSSQKSLLSSTSNNRLDYLQVHLSIRNKKTLSSSTAATNYPLSPNVHNNDGSEEPTTNVSGITGVVGTGGPTITSRGSAPIGPVRIMINGYDASLLDVIDDDDMIVIVASSNDNDDRSNNTTRNNNRNSTTRSMIDNQKIILGIMIGKAQIWTNQSNNRTMTPSRTLSSPSSSNLNNKNNLLPGTIQIIPSSTIDDIINTEQQQQYLSNSQINSSSRSNTPFDHNNEVPKTPITSIIMTSPATCDDGTDQKSVVVSTSSTTPTSFSFRNFTPSPVKKSITSPIKSNTTSKKNNVQKVPLWLIPVRNSIMAKELFTKLTSSNNCKQLILIPINHQAILLQQKQQKMTTSDNNNDTTNKSNNDSAAQRMLERLVIAYGNERYIQKNDRIKISFQGQTLEFCINQIICNDDKKPMEKYTSSSQSLTDHDDNDNNLVNEFQKKLILDDINNNNNNNNNDIGKNTENENISSNVFLQNIIEKITSGNNSELLFQFYKIDYNTKILFDWNSNYHQSHQSISTKNPSMNFDNSNTISSPQPLSSSSVALASPRNIFNNEISSTENTTNQQQQSVNNNVKQEVPFPLLYVAGLETTLNEAYSILKVPLYQYEYFIQHNMKPSRGLLLYGSSGVGKTSLAKEIGSQFILRQQQSKSSVSSSSLKQQIQLQVQYINCATLQSKSSIVGDAERELSRLFRNTKMTKLLILDDIHLICSRRGSVNNTNQIGSDRLASTLLALMDGITTTTNNNMHDDNNNNNNIVILAITTDPSVLDPALRRPGRLDYEIEVPIPDDGETRTKIIQFHLNKLGVTLIPTPQTNDDMLSVGMLAKGFNGADCMLAIKEAIRISILKQHNNNKNSDSNGVISRDSSDNHYIHDRSLPVIRNNSMFELHVDDLRSAIRMTHPSAIKSITLEIPKVLWTSIGGMDHVKSELQNAIELPMTHYDSYQKLNLSPPRGILLYGPPGCSKTLMARALATESSMNFLAVKGPELLSKWLGESERTLASIFRRARMASPCIIFFDEIDAIASKRSSGSSTSSNRLLSQLLTELDGINNINMSSSALIRDSNNNKQIAKRVLVVGATNRPDLLDFALTRPGRIDKMIYVGVPDYDSRYQIFEITLQNKSRDHANICLEELANLSHGYSGAEIVAICRDAALLSLEEQMIYHNIENMTENTTKMVPVITMQHLINAIENMPQQITQEMLNFYQEFHQRTV